MIAWVITLGVIVFYEFKECHELPWPPRIIGAALVFFFLYLFSFISEELAGVMAIGVVLGAIVNKGFNTSTSQCQHAEATAQPPSYQSLQGPNTTAA